MKGQHGVPRRVPGGGEVGVERGTGVLRGLGGLSGDLLYPAVTEALRAPGKIPGCSGTRNLHDNLSDLRAQVAANQKGIQLVGELIGQYGLDVVQAYMGHIQVGLARRGRGAARWGGGGPRTTWKAAPLLTEHAVCQANAELAVRDMLRAFGTSRQARGLPLEVSAEDHMDDGSPIRLRVQINLSQVRRRRRRGGGVGRCGHQAAADPAPLPRPAGRAAPCSTSAAPGRRCSATSTPRGPSRCRRSSTVCAVWWGATSRSTRCACGVALNGPGGAGGRTEG